MRKQTADIACDQWIRLRAKRVLYGAPPLDAGTGRPRVQGNKSILLLPEGLLKHSTAAKG
ncbi:MAG: hypothetical protein KME45_22585 [Stenomitos rutilans HA7619-LM2]|nr:hypothetical protein [Stenomitos rutilans HA7619-LM2]